MVFYNISPPFSCFAPGRGTRDSSTQSRAGGALAILRPAVHREPGAQQRGEAQLG